MRMKQPSRAKKPAPMKGAPRFTRALGTPAMILLVLTVAGAAIIMAARPGQPGGSQPTPAEARRAAAAAAAPAVAMPRSVEPAVAGTTGSEPTGRVASAAKTAEPVTITGCLQAEQYAFVLKNTAGDDAPKARSWKSGFLKKGAAPIEVVDASQKLKLPTHVGKRVSVTGVLHGREMQVRSLQRVAPSCDQKKS